MLLQSLQNAGCLLHLRHISLRTRCISSAREPHVAHAYHARWYRQSQQHRSLKMPSSDSEPVCTVQNLSLPPLCTQTGWWRQRQEDTERGFRTIYGPSSLPQGQTLLSYYLRQASANFFYKGPDSNYFWLCGPYGLCHNTPTPLLRCESSHTQYGYEWAGLCSNKTLFTKVGRGPNLDHRKESAHF